MNPRNFHPAALVLLAALAGAVLPAHAQMLGGATIAADASIARSDARWMQKVARAGATAFEAGRLAATQGQREEIRAFGKTVIDEQGKANAELNAIATRKRVLLTNKPDRAQRKMLAGLAPLKGAAFDHAFMRTAGEHDRINTALMLEDGADQLKDPELRDYAGKTLAKVKRQYEMLRELRPMP